MAELSNCPKCGKQLIGSVKWVDGVKVHETCSKQMAGTVTAVPPRAAPQSPPPPDEEEEVPMPENLASDPAPLGTPYAPTRIMSAMPLPEAPVSDTFQWVDSHGFVHLLTTRAWTPNELYAALAEQMATIAQHGGRPYVRDDNRFDVKVQDAPKPSNGGVKSPVAPAAPAKTATQMATQTATSAPATGCEVVLVVEKIKIVPSADGRHQVQFFGPNRKFADITWYTDEGRAIAGLAVVAGFGTEHFKMAGEYALACKAIYTLSSKLNSKGTPYKDFVRVEAV